MTLIATLYENLRLLINFFYPSMKQITKLQGQLLELVRRKNMQILYPGLSYPGATEEMRKQLFG